MMTLLVTASCQQNSLVSVWTLADVQCAPEDSPNAIHRAKAVSDIDCVGKAAQRAINGALVAQFSRASLTCSVLTFQSVCRSLISGRSPSCAVFYRFAFINGRSMSAKLSNVWLADDVNRLENLVCQADEDSNRLHPVAVQWSSEGAVFDGSTAFAVLNKSSISFASGLTWLLRFKRQPRTQPFIEFTDCSNINGPSFRGISMWEYDAPRRLYVRTNAITGPLLPVVYSQPNLLSASSDAWLNIGFTASGGSFDLFAMDSFVSQGNLQPTPDTDSCIVSNANLCLYVGMRIDPPTNPKLQGTLRALALSGARMTEAEIREFFNWIG